MFKNIAMKFLKRIAVIIAVVLLIVTVRYAAAGSKSAIKLTASDQEEIQRIVRNEELQKLSGEGLEKIAENSSLSLSLDFTDGNIEVLNKKNGYIWRSKPLEEEAALEKTNDLWKENLMSPIIIGYISKYNDLNPSLGNVKNQDTELSFFELEHGARIYFNFRKTGIKIAYDIQLKDDHLQVEVPGYMIEEPAPVEKGDGSGKKESGIKLADYSVYPFFGAARSDMGEKGYLFLPDGPGALLRFEKNKAYNSEYIGSVYGADLSLLNIYDSSLENAMNNSMANYPVYGIARGQNSMAAVIDKGESTADIIGVPANVRTGFNAAYARFNHRSRYKILTNLTGAGYFRYSEFTLNETRTIKYYFQSGEKSGYAGMAENYRKYLIEYKGLEKIEPDKKDIPLQLWILGGDKKWGFMGDSFVAMTTFEQARNITEFFFENGVKNMDVLLYGWGKQGASTEYPDRFPVEKALGGPAGLKDFIGAAHEKGFTVYLDDNNLNVSSGKGISKRKDTLKSIQGNPINLAFRGDYLILAPDAVNRILKKNIPLYKELGADGILENGISSFLCSDLNKANPKGRSQMKQEYSGILHSIREEFDGLRINSRKAYALGRNTTIYNMVDDYGYSTIIDDVIPFYQIALHGLVDYVTAPYNMMDEPAREFLRAVEYGANVSFLVTYRPTERLKGTGSEYLYSTEFNKWKETILQKYRRVNEVLGNVRGAFITGHEEIAGKVVKVTYENGFTILCNYSEKPYTYDSVVINPMDFTVIERK